MIPATVARSAGTNRLIVGIVVAIVTVRFLGGICVGDKIQFGAAVALLFNVLMVAVTMIALALTVPRDDPDVER